MQRDKWSRGTVFLPRPNHLCTRLTTSSLDYLNLTCDFIMGHLLRAQVLSSLLSVAVKKPLVNSDNSAGGWTRSVLLNIAAIRPAEGEVAPLSQVGDRVGGTVPPPDRHRDASTSG